MGLGFYRRPLALRDCNVPDDTVTDPLARLRKGKATRFADLNKDQRSALADLAAKLWMSKRHTLSYASAGLKVAADVGVVVCHSDTAGFKQGIFRRVQILHELEGVSANNRAAEVADALYLSPARRYDGSQCQTVPPAPVGQGRTGRSGRKKKVTLEVASDKTRQPFKGAADHDTYQAAVKKATATAVTQIRQNGISVRRAAMLLGSLLEDEEGISLGLTRCKYKIKESLANEDTPVTPQKTGGVFVPSSAEIRLAAMVKKLRERKFPVFLEDVISWCTELIAGTAYEKNFSATKGEATQGWYRGFIRRRGMVNGYGGSTATGDDSPRMVH